MLDDTELDIPEGPGSEPPRRPGNRFIVVAGALGAIMLLALVAIVIYALVILPEQEPAAPGPSAIELTASALARVQVTDTPLATSTASATPTNTNTPRPTNTPLLTSTSDPATETVNALLTQAALAQTQAVSPTPDGPTATPGTPTATPSALPDSGFADDAGVPVLVGAAALLLAVIFVARRLRQAE